MPKFLEEALKREYGANSKIPYKVMNSIGAMRGNRETAKGAAMEAKHDAKKGLHPALKERASMVKEAHAHLSTALPGFRQLSVRQQMVATQHHVNLRKGTVK